MRDDLSRKILFVDDEKNILDGIRRQLYGQFEVDTALGGNEGLEKVIHNGPYAVVVSDLKMDDLDGMSFLKEVRHTCPDTVCVVLTGFADLEVAVQAVNEREIFRFLTKPCPPEQLRATLRDSLNHYHSLMRMTSYTYTTYVKHGQPIWTDRSRGCLAVTGYSAQEFLDNGELFLDIVLDDYRPGIRDQIQAVIDAKEIAPVELQVRKKDGTVRWIRDTMIPHCDAQGNVFKYDGLVEDITEQKEMQKALALSEKRYHRMVANAPGLVFQLIRAKDATFRFEFVSDSARDLFGIEPEQLYRNPNILFGRFDSQDMGKFLQAIEVSAQKKAPLEWWGRWSENSMHRWCQCVARPEPLDSGEFLFDGLLLDVTELKRIEQEARNLAQFPSENPNPVLRVNANGKIIYANKASDPLLRLWDKSVGEMLPDDMLQLSSAVRASGCYDCVEVKCRDRFFSTVFAPIQQDTDDYVNIYARDITEAKLVEMELIRTNEILKEHDRLKSEFVSTVSHELRTPLCIFKNIISNAMAGIMGKLTPDMQKNLEMADRSIDRLSRIISDFLDIAKIESGVLKLNKTSFVVQDTVNEVVENLTTLASAKNITLRAALPKKKVTIRADRDRIIQVLTNLVGNAVKFISVNGHVEIEVREADDEVVFAVQDDGPGMTKEEMEQIFDRFVQVQLQTGPGEHGTGLGLTITRELIEMHRGKIWVDSVPDQGTCFHFSIPKDLPADRNESSDHLIERMTDE